MNCPKCNQVIPPGASFCAHCGAPVQQQPPQAEFAAPNTVYPTPPPIMKSPALAAILSCLVTGVGQIYNGQVTKGVCILIGALVLSSITVGIAFPVCWILAMVDAYCIAQKINAGLVPGEWDWF